MVSVYKNANINGKLCDIEITDGIFTHIGKSEKSGKDLGGLDVFPGLIDIHCHGCLGEDAYTGFVKLEEMCVFMAKNGITTWYPTIGSIPHDKLEKAMAVNYEVHAGANVPGLHLEGPYIAGNALGSGSSDNIADPKHYKIPYIEKVKLLNIAPEIDGALDFIRNADFRIALGHSAADYSLACEAARAGATSLTHIFNAMPPFHHREPGLIGAAIENDMYVQLICDGIHIHKSVVTAVYRMFGRDRVILVSDAVCGLGLPEGEHIIHGNVKRIIKDGAIRTPEGRLAGSAFTLYHDVLKAIEFGIPREDAFYMASAAPANYMGLNKGRIGVGADADFIAVDSSNSLKLTVVGGKEI